MKEIKNSVGRPTKMTPEVVMKLEQAFSIDSSVEEACSYADISRNTFYVWLKENPQYQDRIDELRQKPILKARQTIVSSLDNPQHAQWYLSRKKKLEFSERNELTGADGEKLNLGVVVLPQKNESTLATPTETESSPS